MNWLARSGASALLLDFGGFAGWRLPLALGLMLAGALAEGFGILMLVPLVASAIGAAGLPGELAVLLAPFQQFAPDERFMFALGLFAAAMTARALLLHVRDLALAMLLADYEASLQLRAAATLAERGWAFASRIGQAGMQSLLLSEVPRAAQAVDRAQSAAIAAVMIAVQVALAAILSLEMAALALLMVFGGYALSWGWTAKGVRSGVALSASYEQSSAAGFRVHAGLKAALAQGTVPQFLHEYRLSLERLKTEVIRFARDHSAARTIISIGAAIAAALLLFVGHVMLKLPFPVLITILILFARMAAPAQQLQQSTQSVAAYAPAFAAIVGALGVLRSPPAKLVRHEPLKWDELRLEGVSYEHAPGLGLKDVSLVLHKSEWLGIVGASGAGKTTLIDIASCLAQPSSGKVTVDGKRLETATLDRWRASLAYVGQGDTIFDDTIRRNLVADGVAADDDGLWQALETVELAGRIRALAAGLDQPVGDRGSSLSGGERQRLALARALLRKPSLLILDEATSALDAAMEQTVLQRIRALDPRPAAVIIAHKSSAIELCDRKAEVEEGRVRSAVVG